ncbi:MAG: FAD-dependent monooxygenase, partial [Thalassobaculaceae bacterium]
MKVRNDEECPMAKLNGEVAIVGGGLSGMAMAIALDSIGVSTLLIDRSATALDPAAI